MKLLDTYTTTRTHPAIMLNEANVFNASIEYRDNSITKYVKIYTDLLGDATKALFTKKLSKLLLNDDRFLYVIHDLPPNAPEWAKTAVKSGELMYFLPNEQLNAEMENITHYLSALEQDIKSQDGNVRNFAKREIQGFPKLVNLDLISTKANEYFKRGSKKASRDIEGMVQVVDAGDGYLWYKLQTTEAFVREGKVLQNCIGGHWSKANADRQDMSILVLRGPTNDAHVAARIDNNSNDILEINGKNNKTPIAKYIPYVQQLLIKANLNLDRVAYAFEKVGYYYIDNKLITQQQALEDYTKTSTIHEEGNNTLVVHTGGAKGIMKLLFPRLVHSDNDTNNLVYEWRTNNHPIIMALVVNKELIRMEKVKTGINESTTLVFENDFYKSDEGKKFISMLLQHKLIKSASKEVTTGLFWDDNLKIDSNANTVNQIVPSKVTKTNNTHSWDEHKNKDVINTVHGQLKDSVQYAFDDPSYIEKIYKAEDPDKDSDDKLILLQTKDDMLLPSRVEYDTSNNSGGHLNIKPQIGATIQGWKITSREPDTIKSVIELANNNKLRLPSAFVYNNRIIEKDDKYEYYNPSPQILGDFPNVRKIDLSDMDPLNKLTAINSVIISNDIRNMRSIDHNELSDDFQFKDQVKKGYDNWDHDKNNSSHYWGSDSHETQGDIVDWPPEKTDQIMSTIFKKDIPDAIYLVDIQYSNDKHHEVAMLVSGNKVIQVDDTTSKQEFQRKKDHEGAVKQVSDFADAYGLTFKKGSMLSSGLLRDSNGKMVTSVQAHANQLQTMKDKGHIGTGKSDEILFADGWKLGRMSTPELSKWTTKVLRKNNVTAEGWKLTNNKNKIVAIVTLKNNTIQNVYSGYRETKGILGITEQQLKNEHTPYIATAINKLKWKTRPIGLLTIKPDSKKHQILTRLSQSIGDPIPRTRALSDVGINPVSLAGWGNSGAPDYQLFSAGLLDVKFSGKNDFFKSIFLTPKGIKAVKTLDDGTSYNILDGSPVAKTKKGWRVNAKRQIKESIANDSLFGTLYHHMRKKNEII